MPVDELDRVFDRDDVAFALAIDLVDHRGEGRRLARARGPRDQHETARLLRHLRDRGGETEIGEGADVERDLPNDHRDAAALLEAVAAEPRQVLNAEGEVELVLHLEALLLVLRQHRVRELQRVLRREHVFEPGVRDVTIDAKLRTLAGRDVQVRRIALDHFLEQRAEIDVCGARAGRRSGHGTRASGVCSCEGTTLSHGLTRSVASARCDPGAPPNETELGYERDGPAAASVTWSSV